MIDVVKITVYYMAMSQRTIYKQIEVLDWLKSISLMVEIFQSIPTFRSMFCDICS